MKRHILTAALIVSTAWGNAFSVMPDFIAEDDDYAEDPEQLDDGLFYLLTELKQIKYTDSADQLYQHRLITLIPLIMEKADPDLTLPETKGNTALHYACALGNINLVQWLISHGADTKARTKRGASVRDCVGKVNRKAIFRILDEAKPRTIHAKPTTGNAPVNAGGKTFIFSCDYEEIVAPMEIRRDDTYDFLQPGDNDSYIVTWEKSNSETKENPTECIAATYMHTGTDAATITYEFNSMESWYTRTFELQFTSPTSGNATCIVTGQPTAIWAEKIIYTGKFRLE